MGSKNADLNRKNKKKKKNKPIKDSGTDADHKSHSEGGGAGGRKIITDPRFASVHSDPRFQNVPKHKSKVVIDSRFNRMFTDKNFSSISAPSDKRGKIKKHKLGNSLRHYYRIGEDDDAREEVEKEKKIVSDEDEDESEEEVKDQSDKEELEKLDSESSGRELSNELEVSESDDDTESATDEEDEGVVYEDDVHEVEVENIPTIEDGTHRLAVVNMDWRHVRAVDLYVLLCSFLPKGGEILSVAVYPSEFGLQRMKEEEVHGPVGLFDDEKENNDDDSSGDDDDEIDDTKLRAYEKSRLRYYYAVVECNSVATAEHLYKSCDGVEFERSSNVLDLRFIPDSMEFKHPPRDVATDAPGSYEGLDFHTKALQHSNIPISWDEDEPQRAKTLKRKFNADQLADLEMKEFLASDESESDDEDENDDGTEDGSDKKLKKRDKYRALIESGDGSDGENEEGQDMEITFNTGLEGLSKHILEKRDKKSETVWEEHLRKQREKKKGRKRKSKHSSEDDSSDADEEVIEEADDFFVEEPSAKQGKKDNRTKNDKKEKQLEGKDEVEASRAELELLLADDNGVDNGLKGYNMKRKKSKGKNGKEVPDENKIPAVDYEDPRFSALFNSPLFALDPTDPQFKRSATYARQMAQRQRKSHLQEIGGGEHKNQSTKSQLLSDEPDADKNEQMISDALSSKKEKHEISSLLKSIKMKSKQVQLPSNGKSKRDENLQLRGTKEMENPELSSLIRSVKKKAKLCKNE